MTHVAADFEGADKAQAEAEQALAATIGRSVVRAAGATGGLAAVIAGLLGIATSKDWASRDDFLVSLVVLLAAFPVLTVVNELVRLAACRDSLSKLVQTRVFYSDLLRDARAERDQAQVELKATVVEADVRQRLFEAYYRKAMANRAEENDE